MMLTMTIKRYWILTRLLMFPFRWLKWMMQLGVVLLLIGLPVHLVWHSPVCAFIGGIFVMANIVMNCISLPNQMLSLNSSKQFGLLPNVRKQSGNIFFAFNVLVAMAITVMCALKTSSDIGHNFLVIFVMSSVFILGGLIITFRWQWAQGLLFATFALQVSVFAWLMTLNPLIHVALLIINWGIFFRWWLTWKPTRIYKNYFGMSADEMLKQREANQLLWTNGIVKIIAEKPRTLIGTVLLGSSDGWKARITNGVPSVVMFILMVGLLKIFIGSAGFESFILMAPMLFFVGYTSSSYIFNGHLFRNLHKLWMFYPAARETLFLQLEKIYCPWALVVILPLAALQLTAPLVITSMLNDYRVVLLLILAAAELLAFNFYMGIIIYCKSRANLSTSTWVNVGMALFSMIVISVLGVVWVDYKMQMLPLVIVSMLAILGGVILLRLWAKKLWLRVDFMRPIK